MKNELISIVAPVYNIAPYLNKFIDSILSQTYENYELIIINDGSTDESENIIKKYNDKRIKYYKHDNRGVSFTRNKGIQLAKGEFICFVDSDDYVEKEYLEELINAIVDNDSDLAICEYKIIENEKMKIEHINKNDNYHNVIINSLKKGCSYISLINKMFRKSIILGNSIKFSEDITNGEDTEFVFHYLSCIKTVSFVDKPLYFYVRRNGSISYNRKSSEKFNNNWLSEEIAIKNIENFIHKKYHKYMSILYVDYCSHILELMAYFNVYDERYKRCVDLLRKYVLRDVLLSNGSLKSKIKLLIISINPRLFFEYKKHRVSG